jgi:hypothetical protein
MDDDTLVLTFEAGDVPPQGFHHAEHVRVAWYYLHRHSLPDALGRFSRGLRRFADARGKPGLYHETITTAYVLLINERLDGEARKMSWEAFAKDNSDLLSWKPSILDRYYERPTLESERARRTFVLPDRLRSNGR